MSFNACRRGSQSSMLSHKKGDEMIFSLPVGHSTRILIFMGAVAH